MTTDTVFREMIQEAVTVEEFISISRHERYFTLFPPRTWNVIIRILTTPAQPLHPPATVEPPPEIRPPRYRKKSETDPRPRRPSLQPVHETEAPTTVATPGSVRSRRTSRSGSVWDYDLRSMTEEDVDFTRADRESVWSEDTGYTFRTSRSIAERSSSEFLEDVPTFTSRPGQPRGVAIPARYSGVSQNYVTYSSSVGDLRGTSSVMDRERSEVVVSSSLVRAMDLASSIGEREDVHSVTETDIYDWNR